MKHEIMNSRKQIVGEWNDEEKPRKYYIRRSWKLGQIFHHKKFNDAIAIDVNILAKLREYKIKIIQVYIPDLPCEEPFYVECKTEDFIKNSEEFCYDKRNKGIQFTGYGVQRRISLHHKIFSKIIFGQERLKV